MYKSLTMRFSFGIKGNPFRRELSRRRGCGLHRFVPFFIQFCNRIAVSAIVIVAQIETEEVTPLTFLLIHLARLFRKIIWFWF